MRRFKHFQLTSLFELPAFLPNLGSTAATHEASTISYHLRTVFWCAAKTEPQNQR